MPANGSNEYLQATDRQRRYGIDPNLADTYNARQERLNRESLSQLAEEGDIAAAGTAKMGDIASQGIDKTRGAYYQGKERRYQEKKRKAEDDFLDSVDEQGDLPDAVKSAGAGSSGGMDLTGSPAQTGPAPRSEYVTREPAAPTAAAKNSGNLGQDEYQRMMSPHMYATPDASVNIDRRNVGSPPVPSSDTPAPTPMQRMQPHPDEARMPPPELSAASRPDLFNGGMQLASYNPTANPPAPDAMSEEDGVNGVDQTSPHESEPRAALAPQDVALDNIPKNTGMAPQAMPASFINDAQGHPMQTPQQNRGYSFNGQPLTRRQMMWEMNLQRAEEEVNAIQRGVRGPHGGYDQWTNIGVTPENLPILSNKRTGEQKVGTVKIAPKVQKGAGSGSGAGEKQLSKEREGLKKTFIDSGQRSNIGLLKNKIIAAESVDTLIKAHPDFQLNPQFQTEVAMGLTKMILGSIPAEAQIEAMDPKTRGTYIANMLQKVTNEPVSANNPKFIKQFSDTIAREKTTAQNQIGRVVGQARYAAPNLYKSDPGAFYGLTGADKNDFEEVDGKFRYKDHPQAGDKPKHVTQPGPDGTVHTYTLNPDTGKYE